MHSFHQGKQQEETEGLAMGGKTMVKVVSGHLYLRGSRFVGKPESPGPHPDWTISTAPTLRVPSSLNYWEGPSILVEKRAQKRRRPENKPLEC